MAVVNEAVAGHTVNQMELNTMDVSFVPQGKQHALSLTQRVSGARQQYYAVCLSSADRHGAALLAEACA